MKLNVRMLFGWLCYASVPPQRKKFDFSRRVWYLAHRWSYRASFSVISLISLTPLRSVACIKTLKIFPVSGIYIQQDLAVCKHVFGLCNSVNSPWNQHTQVSFALFPVMNNFFSVAELATQTNKLSKMMFLDMDSVAGDHFTNYLVSVQDTAMSLATSGRSAT